MKLYAQQYSKRVTHLSQQGYGKKKFNLEKLEHVRIPKKTSIGRRPKLSSMNKNRKRQKGKSKNRGQGK